MKKTNKKIVYEVVSLVVLLLVFITFFAMRSNPSATNTPADTSAEQDFNTGFDEPALEDVKKRDNNQPAVNPSDVGKSNPFAF